MRAMSTALSTWASLLAVVSSMPINGTTIATFWAKAQSNLRIRDHDREHGDPEEIRTAFTVVSMFCMTLLAGMAGYRLRNTNTKGFRSLSVCHYLLFLLYFFSMSFVLSAAVVVRCARLGVRPC